MPIIPVIVILFLSYLLLFPTAHWLSVWPGGTLIPHSSLLYAFMDKVGRFWVVFDTVGNYFTHRNWFPVSKVSKDDRYAELWWPIPEPPLRSPFIVLPPVVLDDVLILFAGELADALGPDEKGHYIVAADIAFVFQASQTIPLSSTGHELFVSQLSLYNQLLRFSTHIGPILHFIAA